MTRKTKKRIRAGMAVAAVAILAYAIISLLSSLFFAKQLSKEQPTELEPTAKQLVNSQVTVNSNEDIKLLDGVWQTASGEPITVGDKGNDRKFKSFSEVMKVVGEEKATFIAALTAASVSTDEIQKTVNYESSGGVMPKMILINGGMNVSDDQARKQVVADGYLTADEAAVAAVARTNSVLNSYWDRDSGVIKSYKDTRPYTTVLLSVHQGDGALPVIKADCGNIVRPNPEPTPEPQKPTPEPQKPTPEPQKPTPEPQKPTPEPQKPTPQLIDISGKKYWDDEGWGGRPSVLTVQLWKTVSGRTSFVREQKISGKGDIWPFSFGQLPATESGISVRYFIKEIVPVGYSVFYHGKFDITNYRREPKPPTPIPPTPKPPTPEQEPKSSDPKDYQYPEDKPKAPAPDPRDAEETPPPFVDQAEPAPTPSVDIGSGPIAPDNQPPAPAPEQVHDEAKKEATPAMGEEVPPVFNGEIADPDTVQP